MAKLVVSTLVLATALACGAIAPTARAVGLGPTTTENDPRVDVIERAQVWTPTNVRGMDIRRGPRRADGFAFQESVHCDYSPEDLAGGSPKFSCVKGDDELKVKFGGANAEVYAEVAASRLLWALGFGADAMYPVRVVCRGCPTVLAGIARPGKEMLFDPVAIERKMPGRELEPDSAWAWAELDLVNPARGGAPLAHRDALKLLAVFLQHTDSKPQQQRIMCLDERAEEGVCRRPFMMVSDVGLTFGRANRFNDNTLGMNLTAWSAVPVFKGETGCLGNLPKSLTGTLDDPVISEEGRAFLAGLLTRLTDDQIRAIFETARVTLRLRDPARARSGFATVGEWVETFKQKRAEIANRRCT